MAEPVRLTEQEGQKLQRVVRRGSSSTARFRRAMMLLALAGGDTVPVIAKLVQADEDTVRDVIHQIRMQPTVLSAWICRSSNCPLVDTRAYLTRLPVRTAGTGARRSAVSSPWGGCTRQIVQKTVLRKFLSTSTSDTVLWA